MRLSRSAELRGACSLVRICSSWCLLITGLFCSSIHLRWSSRCFLMPSSKSMIVWLRAEKQRLLCPLCEARLFAKKIKRHAPLTLRRLCNYYCYYRVIHRPSFPPTIAVPVSSSMLQVPSIICAIPLQYHLNCI
jgi:hypothetical protein